MLIVRAIRQDLILMTNRNGASLWLTTDLADIGTTTAGIVATQRDFRPRWVGITSRHGGSTSHYITEARAAKRRAGSDDIMRKDEGATLLYASAETVQS